MSINAITSAPYFLWKGPWDSVARDSRDMGIVVTEYPPYTRPKERVTQQTIPGRQGQLILHEADWPVYDPVLRTVKCYTRPSADIGAICAWLTGTGELTLGNDPNYIIDATIINQIDFAQILRGNKGYREFSIPFQCDPFKRALAEGVTSTQEVNEDGNLALYAKNLGHVTVPAIITVYAGGNYQVAVGGTSVSVNGADDNDRRYGICLNWDTGIITRGINDGARRNKLVSGGPQYIEPVAQTTAQQGVSVVVMGSDLVRVEVRNNWRWL